MRFNYTYRITYGSGQCCDRSREQLTIEITREQYGRIIEQGRVKLEDSRKNGMAMLMDTDQFLDLVVRW